MDRAEEDRQHGIFPEYDADCPYAHVAPAKCVDCALERSARNKKLAMRQGALPEPCTVSKLSCTRLG